MWHIAYCSHERKWWCATTQSRQEGLSHNSFFRFFKHLNLYIQKVIHDNVDLALKFERGAKFGEYKVPAHMDIVVLLQEGVDIHRFCFVVNWLLICGRYASNQTKRWLNQEWCSRPWDMVTVIIFLWWYVMNNNKLYINFINCHCPCKS